jgi:O-methyltransferase
MLKPWLNKRLQTYLFNKKIVLVDYNYSEKKEVFDIVSTVKKESDLLYSINEACQLYTIVTATQKLEGDIAEVGVYRGETAKIICLAKRESKYLHLFDTFEGLPDASIYDDKRFTKNKYQCNIKIVTDYLKDFQNVIFYKGLFPETASPIKGEKFCMVHLDVDLYQSTKDALSFFYTRMVSGGVILSHDYSYSSGVKKAFDDFFATKIEPVIKLTDSQCMITKC